MGKDSKISWCTHSANFWWGCFKISDGCRFCYAETWANRWGKSIWGPPSTTQREYKKAAWRDVPKWNKEAKASGVRARVFVQSMSDFFEEHPQVIEWRRDALKLMLNCENLDFQILTKRPENIMRHVEEAGKSLLKLAQYKEGKRLLQWVRHGAEYAPDNFWLGTSVENQEQADKRIPHLLQVPAKVRFLNCEPLLGPLDLSQWLGVFYSEYYQRWEVDERGSIFGKWWPDWIICGAESGHGARPMQLDWVRSLRDQCVGANVPFFFKQMIVDGKKVELPELDGQVWAQMPTAEAQP